MDLINNMGLQEEVLQRATTDGKLDEALSSMKAVRKVRPELITTDPALLKSFPNGGADVANMDEDDYITEMLGALSNEYKDDEAMEGMTGGQRIEKLMRKHPKSLDTFFSEVGRRLQGESDANMQVAGDIVNQFAGGDEVEYLENRVSRNETREEYRARTADEKQAKKMEGVQNLINNTPTFPHMKG